MTALGRRYPDAMALLPPRYMEFLFASSTQGVLQYLDLETALPHLDAHSPIAVEMELVGGQVF